MAIRKNWPTPLSIPAESILLAERKTRNFTCSLFRTPTNERALAVTWNAQVDQRLLQNSVARVMLSLCQKVGITLPDYRVDWTENVKSKASARTRFA